MSSSCVVSFSCSLGLLELSKWFKTLYYSFSHYMYILIVWFDDLCFYECYCPCWTISPVITMNRGMLIMFLCVCVLFCVSLCWVLCGFLCVCMLCIMVGGMYFYISYGRHTIVWSWLTRNPANMPPEPHIYSV